LERFFVPKTSFLQKKGLRRIWSVSRPKNGSEYRSQEGQKSSKGSPKIFPGGAAASLLPEPMRIRAQSLGRINTLISAFLKTRF